MRQCEYVSFYIGVLLSVTGFFKDCFKSHIYVYVCLHECMGAQKVHKRVNFQELELQVDVSLSTWC